MGAIEIQLLVMARGPSPLKLTWWMVIAMKDSEVVSVQPSVVIDTDLTCRKYIRCEEK